MKRLAFVSTLVVIATMSAAFAQLGRVLPAGTEITLRNDQAITAAPESSGRMFPATVSQDVIGSDGKVAVPSGSRADLAVTRVPGSNEVTLDLRSLNVGNRKYLVNAGSVSRNGGKEGLGKNKRTAEYVGGGALVGTLIGAIAGGGKGAGIGALAGGAAGAGTQVLTRGSKVNIPAESQLSFKLAQDVHLATGVPSSHRKALPAPQPAPPTQR
jgi:hypothetical protein